MFKNILKKILKSVPYATASYSQEGEDLILNKILGGKRNGFYIEVGCHHPYRFSNTFFFYRRGWSGVCIDPLPGTKKLFSRARPRDIALENGISVIPGNLTYYMFNEPALNTFDKTIAKDRDDKNGYRIIKERLISTDTLKTILDGLSIPKEIDFFSIDVEGLDLEVLKSNDWNKYNPRLVLDEVLNDKFSEIKSDLVSQYLSTVGYEPYAKTGLSVIFKKNKYE